jgi:pSer/pThr/pTyr-binding forkhead associated (FHA) protein
MDVRLVVEKGRTSTRSLQLRARETIVGRREGVTLRIASAEVSRRHCRILMQKGYLTIEDLDSANGTYLNGKLIAGRQMLRPGDRLRIGPVTFVVEYQLTQAALDRMLRDQRQEEAIEVVDDTDAVEELTEVAEELEEVTEEAEDMPLAGVLGDEADGPSLADSEEEDFSVPLDAEDEPTEEVTSLEEVESWHMPQTEEFRDLLTNLEGPEEPPRRKRGKASS